MRAEIQTAEFRATSHVDSAGLVRGVSVITEGPAIGHNLHIDRASIESALRVAGSFAGGLKVKLEHSYGVDKIIGALRGFKIDGKQLRADLQLLKAHPAFEFIKELIQKQPATFGLSISFSFIPEKIEGKDFVRFEDIYSVDIVDRPAANPGGLFSSNPTAPRDPTKIAAVFLAAFGQDRFSQVVNQHGAEAAYDIFERTIFYSGLNVPGYDFSKASRFGDRKAPFGLGRGEASRQQAKIDACLERLK